MNSLRRNLLLGVVLAVAVPGAAFAQSTGSLEEVVVTAQKREQPLIDVPMAITAITGTSIEQMSIVSMQDLSLAVPGLVTREDGPGSYTIFLRGLSNQYGNDPLVGVYLDEAPMSLSGYDQLDVRPLDLERVEVLKGPQGTLYGQGSTAGTVRYITHDPDLDSLDGNVEASVAQVDGGNTKGILTSVLNLPIVDDVFGVRLAGTIERGGGWQSQPAAGIKNGNNQDLENVREKSLWRVNSKLRIETMVDVHRNHVQLGLGYENPDRTVPVAVNPAMVLVPKDFDYEVYNVDILYDLGFAQFTSASTYTHLSHQYPFSYFGGPETVYGGTLEGTDARYVHAKQFSQEMRLVSSDDSPLKWTVGAFYRNFERRFADYYDTLYFGTLYTGQTYFSANQSNSYSLFADASYNITKDLEIGAGVRDFHDSQVAVLGDYEKGNFRSLDPRVYADYAIMDGLKAYASVAKGFRSGGFNGFGLPAYNPENLLTYEAGLKGSLADNRFTFDLAAYYSDYSSMLRRGLVFDAASKTFIEDISNIGKARIDGFEGSLNWQATDNLSVGGTFSFISAEVTQVDATDATNIAGDQIDYVPKTAFTLNAVYQFHWMSNVPGYARIDFDHRDKVPYIDRTSFPAQFVPQYSDAINLIDARVAADLGRGLAVELFGTNLANANKYIDPYEAWGNANRTRPRTIGVQVDYDFN